MPVAVDPDQSKVDELLQYLPSGSHSVSSTDNAMAWLRGRHEEYVVVLGPHVPLADALAVAEDLRTTRASTSVVLVRSTVDTQVLTQAMHAGVRDVVADGDRTATAQAMERAYNLWMALRGTAVGSQSGKMITVFSPKGGVGKTTVSVNLALALADGGLRKVCLVDLDLAFGDVAITLQLFPSHTIEHAVGAEDNLDIKFLDSLLTKHDESVTVLAAPNLPDARDRISPLLVSKVLRTLRENYDYVVVDTAPAFDEATLTALDETDECVIVATLDVPTLKNVKVALETMDMLGAADGHRHLLLNRADDAVGIGPEKVETILGMPILVQLSTSIAVAAATNAGRPILVSEPKSGTAEAIRALAGALSSEPESPEGQSPVNRTPAPIEADKSGRRFSRKKR